MASITGTNGKNVLRGTNSADTINGLGGDDTLEGRGGSDRLDGGPGNDTATYRSSPNGVTVDLPAGLAISDGFGRSDTIVSIGHVEGSPHSDTLRGNDNVNHLRGGGGTDDLEGGASNDRLDGGAGRDRAAYYSAPAAVHVDLAKGTARDGYGTVDTLTNIEGVAGSDHNDTLIGNLGVNFLAGGPGHDTLNGSGGNDVLDGDYSSSETGGDDMLRGGDGDDLLNGGPGHDLLDGGPGNDTVTYVASRSAGSLNAVIVDLAAGTVRDQFGGTDTIISVGHVTGAPGGDALNGNDNANNINGFDGDDTINGRGGADFLWGGSGDDTLDGGSDTSRDVFLYQVFEGSSGALITDGNDTIRNLDAGEDVLRLKSGAIDPATLDHTIIVRDDGADTTLHFNEGGATIRLVGVSEPGPGSFDSVSELVDAEIVELA